MTNLTKTPIVALSESDKIVGTQDGETVRFKYSDMKQDILGDQDNLQDQINERVQYFQNLKAAKDSDLPVGRVVSTAGAETAADGGGQFYYVAVTGSGGVVMENGNELVSLGASLYVLPVDDVSQLAGQAGAYEGQQVSLAGWHPNSTVGGGTLLWNPTRAKSDHNGGTVFSPTVPWTTTTADYLNAVGETDPSGLGVWERLQRERYNIFDFGTKNDGSNESDILSKAIQSVDNLFISKTLTNYVFSDSITISKRISIHSDMAICNIAANEPAGGDWLVFNNSDVDIQGLVTICDSRVTAYKPIPNGSDIENIYFSRLENTGGFYTVRAGDLPDGSPLVKNISILDCKSIAPIGQNAGHYIVRNAEGVKIARSKAINGLNTAAFGVAKSVDISITDNSDEGISDSVSEVEASCQIEDALNSNAVVSGNNFTHDIWVDDASDVIVISNSCRLMRISVSGYNNVSPTNVKYSNNNAAAIRIHGFGAPTAPQKVEARFLYNNLNPDGVLVNGVALERSVFCEGNRCSRIELSGNEVLSDASASTALRISRDSGCDYHLSDNDFGTKPHSISSSGGNIYEFRNKNPLYSNGNGYITVGLLGNITTTALSTWTKIPFASIIENANDEWTSGVTFNNDGFYSFDGSLNVTPGAAGARIGFRLYNVTDAAEVSRLAFEELSSTSTVSINLNSIKRYLLSSKEYEIQYFSTNSSTVINSSASATYIEVRKEN